MKAKPETVAELKARRLAFLKMQNWAAGEVKFLEGFIRSLEERGG